VVYAGDGVGSFEYFKVRFSRVIVKDIDSKTCAPKCLGQLVLVAVPARREVAATRIYFGRIVGSPPGLPGGGMTGILPVLGGEFEPDSRRT
jgi:hypothetical protein